MRDRLVAATLVALVVGAHSAGAQTGDSMAAVAGPRAIIGEPRGHPVAEANLDARAQEVASLLRCPVCQGLSVADSPATMALKMKTEVREMLAAGYEQDQILAYFERSYGEFVLLKPPLRGVNWLVWVAPGMGFLVGLLVVSWALLRRTGTVKQDISRQQAIDEQPDDPVLADYVLKARELAYGWPGGVRPAPEKAP